ncbi:MAG: hypothetical protein IJU36_05525, partial [Paludibacteraceae bacterium]|nr:hypothetical protein [Paludibacteraceae bacterium]
MFGMVNRRAGYYIRRSPTGKLYSCRCPDRSRHVKTPAESANQQRFAACYAGCDLTAPKTGEIKN